jgi:uncharacterized protein (DUF1501 family)
MLAFHAGRISALDSLTRRDILRVGAIGCGLTLPKLLSAAEQAPTLAKARSCIILFLSGGPPQHSTWDPKPDTPAEIRGAYAPIATSAPGISIGELFPETAKVINRCAILRAVSTSDNAHSSSGYYMLTGRPHQPTNFENANPGAPNDAPSLGAIVEAVRPDPAALPGAVRLPHHIWNTDGSVWPGQDAGFLGRSRDPWVLQAKASPTGLAVDAIAVPEGLAPERIDRRRSLRDSLARGIGEWLDHPTLNSAADRHLARAWDIVRSPQAQAAFHLAAESDSTRDRYGRTPFGQSTLLARRLVEAGVRLVHVNWYRGADEPDMNPVWDSHLDETNRLKNVLAPPADRAIGGLIADLAERGMLDETLVVVQAEFGRSPRLDAMGGRGHWGSVFSVLLAGGGIQGGIVHGASDKIGGNPREGLVRPEDLTATILSQLGVDPQTELHDALGRPWVASRGRIIRQIL